jgi:dihydroneopterin aldolase
MDSAARGDLEYQIEISGLRLFAYHGVFPEENTLGQEFKIDLRLSVSHASSFENDRLDHVLSYWDALETVKNSFTNNTFKLLETAAESILNALEVYPQIRHARIHLKKLTPPIPVTVDYVGVVLEKRY